MIQQTFNPAKFGFSWTQDGWYRFNHGPAHKDARRARDAAAKRLRSEGHKVQVFTLPNQVVSFGGIGSGKPHIDLEVNVYGLNAYGTEG